MDCEQYVVSFDATIEDALKKIEANKTGTVFLIDLDGHVFGALTDGDVRRALLNGAALDAGAGEYAITNYVFATTKTSREKILKTLDHRIKAIPVIEENGKLLKVITRTTYPLEVEVNRYSSSKAPVRISFSGGGTDLTAYFERYNGAVLSCTLALYSRAKLEKRSDRKIFIHSADLGEQIMIPSIDEIPDPQGDFGLIFALIKIVDPDFGFNLHLRSDIPIRSGMGGSAAISAAVLGCFNEFKEVSWSRYEIANAAFQAERLVLGNAGGWQDQYATVFGGVNFIEFNIEGNLVQPLRIELETLQELEDSLVLVHLGGERTSGKHIETQKQSMNDNKVIMMMQQSAVMARKMKECLLIGELGVFSSIMREAWDLKKKYSKTVTNDYVDHIHSIGMRNGAVAGKLLGAGGGGFMVFIAQKMKKNELIKSLTDEELDLFPVIFDERGLLSWRTTAGESPSDV